MKLVKEKNNRFHIVSRPYVLYGNLGEKYSYIHFEDRSGTTYCVWAFPTADIMRLVRGKMSWKQFAGAVYYQKRRKAPGFSHGDGQAVSRLRVSVGATQFPLAF